MSALAYHSVAENQNAQVASINSGTYSNTNISANARIDYIFRFSNQLVVVAAEQSAQYSPVTSHFLANLNADHNAAFIAVSSQLHDIQIRSRLVEQLFTNVLFDPEQSLAVSLVNLVKANPQKISIAIEHGQNLSIQILHELTQLAEIAKRAQLTINVLVSGNYVLGHKLSENSILFKNKLSIIAAESGQLVPLKSPLFKQKRQWFNSLKKAKWLIISLVTILFLALAGVVVVESINETKLKAKTQATNQPSAPVFVVANKLKTSGAVNTPATNSDILNALSLSEAPEIQLADNNDVLTALTLAESIQPTQTITLAKTPSKLADEVLLIDQHEAEDVVNIYQTMANGFVIQFAAFSEQKVKNDFLKQYSNLEYASYFRLIDGVEFEVLTSVPYATRLEVEQAKASLPESLQALKIWVKSLDAIKSEIKHYQSSQS